MSDQPRTTTKRSRSDFGAVDLFLADSRLASVALNEARFRVLRRTYGVSREDTNLLTLVLVLSACDAVFTAAPRVVGAVTRVSGRDVAIGGFLAREGAVGAAGPAASEVSPFATLLMIAFVGGIAIPTLRRASRRMRVVAHDVRVFRERMYSNARREMANALPRLPGLDLSNDEVTEPEGPTRPVDPASPPAQAHPDDGGRHRRRLRLVIRGRKQGRAVSR